MAILISLSASHHTHSYRSSPYNPHIYKACLPHGIPPLGRWMAPQPPNPHAKTPKRMAAYTAVKTVKKQSRTENGGDLAYWKMQKQTKCPVYSSTEANDTPDMMEYLANAVMSGSVLLLSKTADHNIPLGMRNKATTSSNASLSLTHSGSRRSATIIPVQPPPQEEKKRTRNGKIILEPQPEESKNDP